MDLEVRVDNKRAIALYEKNGIERYDEIKEYYERRRDGDLSGKGFVLRSNVHFFFFSFLEASATISPSNFVAIFADSVQEFPMGFEVFLFKMDSSGSHFDRQSAIDILTREARNPADLSFVEYPNGGGAGEVFGLDDGV